MLGAGIIKCFNNISDETSKCSNSWFVCSPFPSGSVSAAKLLLRFGRGQKLLQLPASRACHMLLYTWSYLDMNYELHSLNLAWKGLLKLFGPIPCFKQVQLDEVAQVLVRRSCEYLQSWRFHNLSDTWQSVFMVIKFFFHLIGISLVTPVC